MVKAKSDSSDSPKSAKSGTRKTPEKAKEPVQAKAAKKLAPRRPKRRVVRALPRERFPVFDIANNDFDEAALPFEFGFTQAQLANLRSAIPSVGRIESSRSNSFFFGTGFVVGPNLIATNRHVAGEFVDGVGRGDELSLTLNSCVINFRREGANGVSSKRCKIVKPLLVHPYWDIALFETEPLPADAVPLRLAATTDAQQFNRVISVIGYPANSDGNNRMSTTLAAVADAIFGAANGIKRLQPGRLRGPVQAFAAAADQIPSLDHSASTLPGNSGSPVIDVETGDVVGIHYGGQDNASNWSVPTSDMCRDRRLAAFAGLNFAAGGVPDPNGPWEAKWTSIGDVA